MKHIFLINVVRFYISIATLCGTLGATTYNCTLFSTPNGSAIANGLNNAGTVSGAYVAGGVEHGFRQDSAGNFTTVDFPGASSTQLFSINNNGVAVGTSSSSGVANFFTVDLANNFKVLSAPAPYTLFGVWGINDSGAISVTVSNPSVGTNNAILNPDGSLSRVPGGYAPGSINDSGQMLESGQATSLVDASGNQTFIQYPNYFFPPTQALGLNNAGTIAGYFASGGPSTLLGFTRDPSGVYSEVICPNTAVGGTAPRAINDNGLILGAFNGRTSVAFIATPLPGEPQITISPNNLSFPATPVGGTSQPQTFTITNTGTQRLDVDPPRIVTNSTNEYFQISGCNAPSGTSFSLAAGESCTASVTVTPSNVASGSGSIAIDDSAPGTPQYITMTVAGNNAPPSCQLSGISGPAPSTASFTAQDAFSGLQSIFVLDSSNATVNIPNNYFGSKSPVSFSATQTDPAQTSKVDFQVTNGVGVSTTCGATFGGGSSTWTGIGGSITGQVSIVRNANGTLQGFARGADNALWTNAQTSPDGPWGTWTSLGGVLSSDPAASLNGNGDLEVFVLGSDGSLWTTAQSSPGGSFSGWRGLGQSLTSDPAVTTDAMGSLHVFAAGNDHALWTIAETSPGGSFGGWTSLGGTILHNPAAITNTSGSIEVFVVGTDNGVWHNWTVDAGFDWAGWSSLGGSIAGSPVAVLNTANGTAAVSGLGADSSIWYTAHPSGSGWTPFASLGGYLTSDPAAAFDSSGSLELFARGGDNGVWYVIGAPGAPFTFGSWAGLGGTINNGPTARINQDGRIAVFVEGTDTAVWTIEQSTAGSWH
jgi:hypothetical protein